MVNRFQSQRMKRREENGMNSQWRRLVRILPERKRYNEKRRVK